MLSEVHGTERHEECRHPAAEHQARREGEAVITRGSGFDRELDTDRSRGDAREAEQVSYPQRKESSIRSRESEVEETVSK